MPTDNRSQPYRSVLIGGTVPNYKNCVPDTSQTNIAPVLLVYQSSSGAENGVTLTSQFYGDAVKTERKIGIVEILKSRANTADDYDKSTAFAAIGTIGCDLVVHWLKAGDQCWVTGSSLSCDEDDLLCCAASGTVQLSAGTTTVDKYNQHVFRPLGAFASATYIAVEYMGDAYQQDSS